MKFVPKLKHLVFFSIIGLTISLDQLTKQLIISRFKLHETLVVIPNFFSITYVRNTGAAFGMLSQWDAAYRIPFFIIVPLVALGFITYLFRQIEDNKVASSAILGAIVGGAIGNLIDRLIFGYVVDFLDFYLTVSGPHFATFNVADIAISVGVFFLIIESYLLEKSANKKLEPKKDPENASHTS